MAISGIGQVGNLSQQAGTQQAQGTEELMAMLAKLLQGNQQQAGAEGGCKGGQCGCGGGSCKGGGCKACKGVGRARSIGGG